MTDSCDDDSTLIRRGASAATLKEMEAFAETLEARPLDKLLVELPAVAELSEAKFRIAVVVLRSRFRKLPEVDQQQLRVLGEEVASSVNDPGIRRKLREIFEPGVKARRSLPSTSR